ncbi:hypothetical protein BCR34DRAFT_597641 [Clohesyomyces aquaticus]|uniref:Rhodopsin domain-containing protein n=1 Tax=Clohesyomyces aquaticus TaxID=1231657 RepID=A0A1Y2A2A3_9PLEO|nr:hypothetical protein BCR34DRAFT_597641 [Clohesyomyces aquaticus]
MFFHVESQAVAVAVIALLLSLDVLAVLARFFTRKSLKQQMKIDDWLIYVALVSLSSSKQGNENACSYLLQPLAVGMAAAYFAGVEQDVLFNQSLDLISKKIEFAVILLSIITLSLVKLSFLFFYGRIFIYDRGNLRSARNVCIGILIGFVILWCLGFSITYLSACRADFSAHWSSKSFETKCTNTFWMLYGLAISDFIMDCLIIILPIPIIWQLYLEPSRKIGVLIVFLLGSLATAASLIRLIWLRWVINLGATPHAHSDPLSLISTELFWNLVEVTVALLAVCLPPLSGMRRTQPGDRVIRSVQSKFSLRSNSSTSITAKPSHDDEKKGAAEGEIGVIPDVVD